MEYIIWNTHKKVKADLKSSGRTKKRLKIWPIDRKDLKRQFSLVHFLVETYWSLVYQLTISPSSSHLNFLLKKRKSILV